MQNINGKTALGLEANVGALICYVGNLICSFGLIYSIIVVATDKTNKFVRFHAWQSILCSVVGLVFGLIAGIGGAVASIVDVQIGFPLLSLVIGLVLIVVGLIVLVMFIKAAMSAYRGEMYRLPFIGNLADKWA